MESPLFKAIRFAKLGDTKKARQVLGIRDEQITDKQIMESLISFQQGYDLITSGQHSKAFVPLKKSLFLIEKSNDPEARFIVNLLTDFAEGIAKLFSGDAVGAYNQLNISAEAFEKVSFFLPNFVKYALSTKAAAHVALARQNINIGDLEKAESLTGAISQIYSDLIPRLDENNGEDLILFAEANGTQLEVFILFSTIDLSAIDFDSAEKRLNAANQFYEKSKFYLPKLKDTPIKLVFEIDLIIYNALKSIVKIGKSIIYEKAYLDEEEIRELREVDVDLFKARTLAHKAQERGRGYFYTINQLSRFQERLLMIGKIQKKDIISISGAISLASFLLLLFSVHFTIRPSGYEAIPYFLGEIIISLVVGFGYGALKFIPLIRLVSEAINMKKDKGEND